MSEYDPRTRGMVETLNEIMQSISNKDIASIGPHFTEDAIMEFPYAPAFWKENARLTGATGIVTRLSAIMLNYKTFNFKSQKIYSCPPDHLIVEAASNNIRKDGSKYSNQYVLVLRFEGTRIAAWKEYFNTDSLATAGSTLEFSGEL